MKNLPALDLTEVMQALINAEPSGFPVKVYTPDGKLRDILSVTIGQSEDPDVESAVVIRCR